MNLETINDFKKLGPFIHWTIEDPTITPEEKYDLLQRILVKVRELITTGSDINDRNDMGHTLISWIVISNYWSNEIANFTRELVHTYGANVNIPENRGFTPLHWASLFNRVSAIRLLLELGADINAVDQRGKDCLYYATENDHYDIIKILRTVR